MNGNDLYEFEESRCYELGKEFTELMWDKVVKAFPLEYSEFVIQKHSDWISGLEDRAGDR